MASSQATVHGIVFGSLRAVLAESRRASGTKMKNEIDSRVPACGIGLPWI
jgi:hypothetical protein